MNDAIQWLEAAPDSPGRLELCEFVDSQEACFTPELHIVHTAGCYGSRRTYVRPMFELIPDDAHPAPAYYSPPQDGNA
ncbi:hypothetical protein ACH4FX_12060 [Streptomyces sp. NPDC018019]|uniref:hypothetical protein n=1 Tax=Streptomyces sp. NPDC018019 TaxID=3365030 RepID=UPI0037ACBEB9